MSGYSYPASKRVTADVISAYGATPVSCKISDGKIIPALAAVEIGTAPEGVLTAAYSAGCGIYTAATESGIYESSNGKRFYSVSSLSCASPVVLEDRFDGKACSVVFGDAYCLFSNGDSNTTRLHGGKYLSCALMHCGRAFGADGEDGLLLRWSGEGGVLDWYQDISGAGWAYMRPECGKILNLLPYGEKIAAVREYGISLITANGTPENFKISSDESFTRRIYANSAASAGGKIYFFTDEGLCVYNGGVLPVKHSLSSGISDPVCCFAAGGTYFSGVYSKALSKRALLVYDISDGSDYLIEVEAEAVCGGSAPLAIGGGKTFTLQNTGGFTFKSGIINFGTSCKKTLDRIEIECGGTCDITVSNGDISRTFTGVSGGVRLNMNGREFTVTVSGTDEIRSLTAGAEVIDGI